MPLTKVDASNIIDGVLPVANGGTGATTQAGAAAAVLPSQTGNSGRYLTTDGTNTSWGDVTQTRISGGTTGLTPNTLTGGDVTLAGTLSAANGGTGLTSPGTSGNVLTSNGTAWVSSAPSSAFTGARGQVFTSSGTFTVPTGVTAVKVTVIGAGGRGRNGTTNGSSGGTSSFGAFCSATGGGGGTSSVGAGGTATGGDINLAGGNGGAGGVGNWNVCNFDNFFYSAGGGGAAGGGNGVSGIATLVAGNQFFQYSGSAGGGSWGKGGDGATGANATGFGNGGRGVAIGGTTGSNQGGGCGGGGGGVAIRYVTGLTAGQTVTVTVGTQGASGTAATDGVVIVEW